jgi:hypothetical protein
VQPRGLYQLGYIDPAAWVAWHNGMKVYLRVPCIRRLWDEDVKSESYYGLKL